MIKLKKKKNCLYLLDVKQYFQMVFRKIYTILTFAIFFIIFLNLPIFSQMPYFYFPNNNENGIALTPYYLWDSCLYFPESIFTIGNFPIGIKFAQNEAKKNTRKSNGKYYENKIENDTSQSKGNRIISIRETDKGDRMAVYLQIENPDKNINIVIYNLLGKKVLDVYEGKPKDPSQPYEFSTNELPKGIFLLVVIGDNFRLREKLIIAK